MTAGARPEGGLEVEVSFPAADAHARDDSATNAAVAAGHR
jgi:hypothetical protein